ncbi:MAG: D-2-hydroxyacid dehydrogenase family protein [Myxococcales bacterium]|nr:MAG: D-2-hydroxyacid dehydrogenase family protein [Myxococcales bacterium]
MRVGVLDDYQGVAERYADWASLPRASKVRFFHDHASAEDALVERLAPFEALVAMRERTPFTASLLRRLPNLKLLVTTGARNAAIDLAAAAELGITVSGTRGLPYPTAELTWALILGLARKIAQEDRALRGGAWQTTVGSGLSGKTLSVLGLGRLGTQVARIGKAFGMQVISWSPHLTAQRANEAGVELVTQDALLERADVLTVHLVLSESTRGLLGARQLSRLKPSALLVNTSRGPLVDEVALAAALRAGALGGAALDVFDVEPLPENHVLRSAPNTLLTPHLGYVTDETYRVFYSDALEAIHAYLGGSPVRVLSA